MDGTSSMSLSFTQSLADELDDTESEWESSFPVFLTRHGESEYNTKDLIGGDSPLSPLGQEYGQNLARWLEASARYNDLVVWTSDLIRTKQTASFLKDPSDPESPKSTLVWPGLNEINAGVFEEMTQEVVKKNHPKEYEARAKDKIRYRYPEGESYEDLMDRISPVVKELSSIGKPILVVAHQAVLRCVYALLKEIPLDPNFPVPLHTVLIVDMNGEKADRRVHLGPQPSKSIH